MAEFIPEAKENNVGIGETIYYCEIIVNAFNKALQENNCMSAIPVAMYMEAELHIGRLEDIGTSIGGDPDDINPDRYDPFPTDPDDDSNPTTGRLMRSLSDSVKKKLGNECIDCGWDEFPKLDLGRLFDNILDDIRNFINQLKNLNFGIDSSMCHFAYLLSYICIPDLIKLLALLLGYLMKLMSKILIRLGSLMLFIMGILGEILGILIRYIMSVIDWAISPIGCILNSLAEILETLPSRDTLKSGLSAEQKEFLKDKSFGSININNGHSTILTPTANYLRAADRNMYATSNKFGDYLRASKEDIETAAESVANTMSDLISITDWMGCENSRSGASTIGDHIEAFMRLTQLINLIMAIITKKANKRTIDELCNPHKNKDRFTRGFTNEDIAEVIQDSFEVGTEIIHSGPDVGILIIPQGEIVDRFTVKYPNRISMFTCNLNEFIQRAHMDNIVEEAVQFAEDQLKGSGFEPRALTIPRRHIDTLTEKERNDIILFRPDEAPDIMDVINEIISFNRSNDISDQNTNRTISEITRKVINSIPESKPSDKPEDKPVKSTDKHFATYSSVGSGNSKIINKPIELRCGTIDNLRDSLNNILTS